MLKANRLSYPAEFRVPFLAWKFSLEFIYGLFAYDTAAEIISTARRGKRRIFRMGQYKTLLGDVYYIKCWISYLFKCVEFFNWIIISVNKTHLTVQVFLKLIEFIEIIINIIINIFIFFGLHTYTYIKKFTYLSL